MQVNYSLHTNPYATQLSRLLIELVPFSLLFIQNQQKNDREYLRRLICGKEAKNGRK